MLTHQNICSNLLQLQTIESGNLSWKGGPSGAGDRILAFLPFFHIYGKIIDQFPALADAPGLTCLIMQSCHRGWELVVMPKFEIERFCQVIQEYKVSFVYLVPPIILLLAKHPIVAKYDLSSLRMLNSGAAPLTRELIDALNRRMPLPVKQGYGLFGDEPDDARAAVGPVGQDGRLDGRAHAQHERQVPRRQRQRAALGETGELALKGPNVFLWAT